MFVIPNGAHLPFSKCVGDLIFFTIGWPWCVSIEKSPNLKTNECSAL